MKVKLKESFILLLMKMYPDFSEITQIRMCLSSINHENENISCITRMSDDYRSCQKLINYIANIKAIPEQYYWIQILPVQ